MPISEPSQGRLGVSSPPVAGLATDRKLQAATRVKMKFLSQSACRQAQARRARPTRHADRHGWAASSYFNLRQFDVSKALPATVDPLLAAVCELCKSAISRGWMPARKQTYKCPPCGRSGPPTCDSLKYVALFVRFDLRSSSSSHEP